MTQIIAFVGLKQTGKTTAAKHLIANHGFVSHNFKDALVEEIKEKFPDLLREIITIEQVMVAEFASGKWPETIDDLFTTKPPLIRALMQNHGTEVRRGDDPDYWVDKWKEELQYLVDMGGVEKFVVDDCRFLSEAKAIRDTKYTESTIIRLTRPDITTPDNHSSETEQSEIVADYTIECKQGDFETLYRELDDIIRGLSK